MRPFVNDFGMRLINAAKYYASVRSHKHAHLQSHAAFAFLCWITSRTGKSPTAPADLSNTRVSSRKKPPKPPSPHKSPSASGAALSRISASSNVTAPTHFLMTHAVDGYSLALDFRVTERNRAALWNLAAELDAIVLNAGGRFYFAKDSTLHPSRLNDYLGETRVRRFLDLKRQCDPENLLQTDLYRRVFQSSSLTIESALEGQIAARR